MRHRNSGRQLSRNSSHRHAMLRNMATSLLRHETIRTTVPKAKELRRVIEPLITLAKVDSLAKRRLAFSRLRDVTVVEKLFAELGPRFKARAGGYTRILKWSRARATPPAWRSCNWWKAPPWRHPSQRTPKRRSSPRAQRVERTPVRRLRRSAARRRQPPKTAGRRTFGLREQR